MKRLNGKKNDILIFYPNLGKPTGEAERTLEQSFDCISFPLIVVHVNHSKCRAWPTWPTWPNNMDCLKGIWIGNKRGEKKSV
jgi:hypothetical protein